MPRQHLPFDPNHKRCLFPAFGKRFDDVMAASGRSAAEIAKAVGIAAENIYGYRRGFSHPSAATRASLEVYLGTSLDPDGAPVKPTSISVQVPLTVHRDDAGGVRFSFSMAAADLATFLAA